MPVFFDTNVLVYCIDPRDSNKQTQAQRLVRQASLSAEGVISTQVLIELYNVLGRKLRVPDVERLAVVQAYMGWSVIDSDMSLVAAAMEKSVRHQLTIFDAMVVEAALRSGATTLYSEDLQDGRRFGSLTITNPFI